MIRFFKAALAAFALIPGAAHAIEVRVCEGALQTAALNDERELQSALLHAVAVVNTGSEPMLLSGLDFRLKSKGVVTDTRRLAQDQVARAVSNAPIVAAIAEQIPNQFCNGTMLKGAQLAKSATLAPGEAVVFLWEVFTWRGTRDALEIVASTERQGVARESRTSMSIESVTARTRALFPVAGRSFVGVAASFHTAHRWVRIEEFALDILAVGASGATFSGAGTQMADYYAYGRPIRAVADGTVARVTSAMTDNLDMIKRADEDGEQYFARLLKAQSELIAQGIEAVLGNHVIIDHGNGEFSVYAHLAQGNPLVKEGQRINAGETIGALGSSGNSTEPHLHFQMCDTADMNRCRSLPVNFDGITLPFDYAPRSIQSGDIVETVK